MRRTRRASTSGAGWRPDITGRWAGWRAAPTSASPPQALWPEAKSAIALAMSYAPAADPLALAGRGEIGRISVYAQGGDYHKTVKKALKALARFIIAAGAERAEGIRRYRAGDGKAARPGGGHRLAGQAYESRFARAWQLAVSRRDPDQPRAGAGRAGRRRRSIAGPAADASTPARPRRSTARTGSMRGECISYLTIEHDGPIPDEFRRGDRQPHLRLRRLPRGMPVEPLRRRGGGEPRVPAARRAGRAASRRPARARRCGVPGDVRRVADQADRPQPHGPQLPDRGGEQRRFGAGAGRPAHMRAIPTRSSPRRRAGRWISSGFRARRRRPPDRCRRRTGKRASTCDTRSSPPPGGV